MADTAFLVLVILSMVLNLFVYTPILIFWIYKVIQWRRSFVIKKRLPKLLTIVIILSIAYFSIEKTIQLFSFGDILDYESKLVLNKVIFYVFQIPFIYFIWLYSLRFWLLYYKLEWSLSMMNNEWKSIIHHSNASDDWFIVNRKQYGSLRYLQKKLIVIISIITLFTIISWILYWESAEPNGYFVWILYIFFVFGPPTLTLFYVAWKLPSYDDYLALKTELKYACYGFIAVILTLIIFFGLINSFTGLSGTPFLSLFLWHIIVFWNFAMITLHSFWVIKRFEPVLRRHRRSDASLFSHFNRVQKAKDNELEKMKKKQDFGNDKTVYKLQAILKHPKSYDIFMHHLWKEHSSECLLSATEFIHFQYLIIYHRDAMNMAKLPSSMHGTINANDHTDKDLYLLHPDIPQSSLVFGINPSNKISQYIKNKFDPQKPKLRPNSLSNVLVKISDAISPSRSKRSRDDLNVLAPTDGASPPRLRNTVSGPQQTSPANILKSKMKKKHKKTYSVSSNVPSRPLPPLKVKKDAPNHSKHQSHSAFLIDFNLNQRDNLVQELEPISPTSASPVSDDSFYKKPTKPTRPPPALPPQMKNNDKLIDFSPIASHSEDNRSSDSSEVDADQEETSMVVHAGMTDELGGIPINLPNQTPPQQPSQPTFDPFGSLPPLSEPEPSYPEPENFNGLDALKRQSQSAKQLQPTKLLVLNERVMRTPSVNSIADQMDSDEEEKQFQVSKRTNNKKKKAHKRTLSLKDLLRGSRSIHRKTQSAQTSTLVLNDRDGHSESKDSEDDYDAESEDSTVTKYKSMSAQVLDEEKSKLMENYRLIAWKLWNKYVRVGAEYEINIDYAERKKFYALMKDKEKWMRGIEGMETEEHLLKLFHRCTEIMITFLTNSFTRFRHKPDFYRVQQFLWIM